MKLHLPIALLTAILSATGITRAAEFGAGTYTYTTDSDGTINSTFIGDCTAGSFGTTNQGYKKAGWVAGIPVSDTDRYAPHTNVTIGDGTTATRVNAAIAVGVRGYASDGNKSITVLNNAYAGTIYGAYNLNTGHNSGLKVQGAESYYSNGKYFAPKATKDKVISITLDGGSAVQVYGGMSQLTTPLPTEMKAAYKALGSKEAAEAYALNDPAWALNEKVEINIINGKVGVTADGNGHSTLISNPTANAITGAGMGGASINNTVSINVDGEDSVVYGSIYAGASEFTNTSYDATTYGRIRGYVENTKVTINNGTINGSVHGGGMEGGLVKKDTRVTLAGGQINGDVYGAGSGDEVAGNTQVVIKGEGATVTGTIYGGGSNNAVVNGDRILTFDSYTANPDADGYATVDWNKYQDFNSLELQNSKVNLGKVGTEYESLKLSNSQAIADSVRNGESVRLNLHGTPGIGGSDLVVNANLKVADGSQVLGLDANNLFGFTPYESSVTAKSITFEGGKDGSNVYASVLKATEGNISLGSNTTVDVSNLIAEKGTVALTDSSVTGSSMKGNSIDISGSTLTDTDITSDATATQQGGSIRLYNTTMNGGDITVGKYINSNSPGDSYNGLHNIEIWSSNVTADSLKGADGAGVHLHFVSNSTKSSLTVKDDLVLEKDSGIYGGLIYADGEFTGLTADITAKSITAAEHIVAQGVNMTATEGDISLTDSTIKQRAGANSTLTAEKGAVALTDSTVTASALKGNSIDISGSTLTDTDITSDATATQQGGSIRLYNTTMNGGDITVGKYINSNSPGDSYNGLHNIEIWNSNVTADSLKGADGAGVHLHFVSNSTKSSLTVKDDLVLEKNSGIYGGLRYADGELTGLTADITAKSITAAEHIYARDVNMTATEGDISLTDSTIEGAFTGSTLTAENGNVVLNNCDVTDTNVVSAGMTMKGGSYANAEDAQDSIKNLHLTDSAVYKNNGTANIDLVTADTNATNYTNEAQLVNNGDMVIGNIWNIQSDYDAEDSLTPNGSLTIKNTEQGNLKVTGSIVDMGSGVDLVQSGGTVAVCGYTDLDSLTVEGNSTFRIEKGASVTVETLALSDATLSFTEGADALTISASGAITALDGVMFELILGESAAPLFEGGPDTTVDFSFTVLDGLANLTAGEDLVTAMQQAFTVEQLQLLGANANGALYDLIIQDATMEYTNGAVTISGKASIPEPTTATLSLLALAALASRRRRQK